MQYSEWGSVEKSCAWMGPGNLWIVPLSSWLVCWSLKREHCWTRMAKYCRVISSTKRWNGKEKGIMAGFNEIHLMVAQLPTTWMCAQRLYTSQIDGHVTCISSMESGKWIFAKHGPAYMVVDCIKKQTIICLTRLGGSDRAQCLQCHGSYRICLHIDDYQRKK